MWRGGQAILDGHTTKVSFNHMIVMPKGAQHNIVNKGAGALKLFSVYAPPAEEPGVAHRTKADAEAAGEDFLSRAAKKVKEALAKQPSAPGSAPVARLPTNSCDPLSADAARPLRLVLDKLLHGPYVRDTEELRCGVERGYNSVTFDQLSGLAGAPVPLKPEANVARPVRTLRHRHNGQEIQSCCDHTAAPTVPDDEHPPFRDIVALASTHGGIKEEATDKLERAQ